MRARGVRPCVSSPRSLTISSAADASEIWLDTAAVTRPSGRSSGSPAIFSRLVSRRGPSSVVTPATGTISRSNRPSSIARTARRCDSSANRSMSSREIPHLAAIMSAERNCDTSWSP